MSTPQLKRLHAYCQRLRLYQVAAELPTLLEQAAKQEHSYTEFLEDLLSREMQGKSANSRPTGCTLPTFTKFRGLG